MPKGFTLLEMLLSIALIGIISGGVVGFSLVFLRSNDHESAMIVATQTFRRAQTLSRASVNDSSWGVKLQPGSLTLFQGVSYALRNVVWDEVNELPSTITPSGVTEILFAKTTGFPTSSGTVTLTHETLGARSLLINAIGTIEE